MIVLAGMAVVGVIYIGLSIAVLSDRVMTEAERRVRELFHTVQFRRNTQACRDARMQRHQTLLVELGVPDTENAGREVDCEVGRKCELSPAC